MERWCRHIKHAVVMQSPVCLQGQGGVRSRHKLQALTSLTLKSGSWKSCLLEQCKAAQCCAEVLSQPSFQGARLSEGLTKPLIWLLFTQFQSLCLLMKASAHNRHTGKDFKHIVCSCFVSRVCQKSQFSIFRGTG